MISYSKVDTWKRCPRKYKFLYVDHIRTVPEIKPDSPLFLGKAFDVGTQYGYDAAEKQYLSDMPVVTDECINWLIQIEYWLPKVQQYLKENGQFQKEVRKGDFIGYVDYLDDSTLIDFKFSNNGDMYAQSPQVILYADCIEPRPERLMYVCAPKTFIRQKNEESLEEFRARLISEMDKKSLDIREVKYDPAVVREFESDVGKMLNDTEFIPMVSEKCKWCDYSDRCEAYLHPKRVIKPRSEMVLNT